VIILAEITARVIFPGWAPARQEPVTYSTYDDLLGWTYTPNQRGRLNHNDFSVEIFTNSQGMSDSEYSVERTWKKRMLVLGDSFGVGFGVEHHERFSEILENAHPDWEIINASVSGYSTDQQFLFLKKRGIAFKPDVVLLLFFKNDFVGNVLAENYWHFKPFYVIERGQLKLQNVPVPNQTSMQRLRLFFNYNSCLIRKIYPGVVRRLRRLVSRKTGNSGKDSGVVQRMGDVTNHLITAMKELCQRNDSIFILVSIPMNVEGRTFLQKITEEEKIPYLPLDAYFESTVTSVRFSYDPHWNAKGHEIAANAIDAFLRKQGVFDPSKSGRYSEDTTSRLVRTRFFE
jgi:hypothetical protein